MNIANTREYSENVVFVKIHGDMWYTSKDQIRLKTKAALEKDQKKARLIETAKKLGVLN